ncbi:class I histocompatibility antigen, F10 alpha chain-like isoform X2 [Sphaerodactylus townsendi]|uniref:class I histocompatibility antigen, F10 alpha chain-like isoform X2 n=1 Tax=Sphaerodactylus townsendi TaxID=933632 RepID=UPI0020265F53|nr:class I histocompatibility antigen, F10 alpha chain-like isoform X2 [Sphaerodactylus townsendi]
MASMQPLLILGATTLLLLGGCSDEDCRGDGNEDFCSPFCFLNEFRCQNGQLVPELWTCDGYDDCGDDSDEAGCACQFFQCRNGHRVEKNELCDGDDNCRDGSDEAGCACSDSQFQCANGRCVPIELSCDGFDHCGDDSDESNCTCTESQFQCRNGRCIYEFWTCDGEDHCLDDSDEANCTCATDQFTCKNRRCIPNLSACDGEDNCGDNSDENDSLCAVQAVTKFDQGLPRFTEVGYMDGQPIEYFDSHVRRVLPRAPWMEENLNEQYWNEQTDLVHVNERWLRDYLLILQNHYNQTRGFHTFQCIQGCELSEDQTKRRYYHQEAYDGRDIDRRTHEETGHWKYFRHEDCIEELKEYLDYGRKALQRKEPPTVKTVHRQGNGSLETLICQVYGFYPKQIKTTWRRDGAVWEQEALRGGVVPNWDGTFNTWLSIQIDPEDRDHYQCHVEQSALEQSDSTWPIVGSVLGAVAALLLLAGILWYITRGRESASNLRGNNSEAQQP